MRRSVFRNVDQRIGSSFRSTRCVRLNPARGYELLLRHFFVSSRIRHTRYWRDWSSDVCSSDLGTRRSPTKASTNARYKLPTGWKRTTEEPRRARRSTPRGEGCEAYVPIRTATARTIRNCERSEERRAGKECRSRWSPYH